MGRAPGYAHVSRYHGGDADVSDATVVAMADTDLFGAVQYE
jgi:hypothetical protein